MYADRAGQWKKREREGQGGGPGPKRFKADDGGGISSTLWMGNLAPETNEEHIRQAYSDCGEIKDIRLKRHHDSGKCKGFGFLEFYDPNCATRALQTKQHFSVLGRPVKLEFSNKPKLKPDRDSFDDKIDDSRGANTFQSAQNLPPNLMQKSLGNLNIASILGSLAGNNPTGAGNVGSSNIAGIGGINNPLAGIPGPLGNLGGLNSLALGNRLGGLGGVSSNTGVPTGAAALVAQLQLQQLAQTLGLNFNQGGIMKQATPVTAVGPDGPPIPVQQQRISEPQRNRAPGCRTIFVGNLSDAIDDDTIFQVFSEIGDIKAIRWLNDRKSGKFKGCGFVEFYSEEAAERAASLNGKPVLGRPMRVDFANQDTAYGPSRSGNQSPDDDDRHDRGRDRRDDSHRGGKSVAPRVKQEFQQSERPPGCTTLFMGNLADSVDEKSLREVFNGIAKVKEVRWLHDKKTGKFKGCGFVDFYDEESAAQAATLNGTYLHGKAMRIDWSVKGPNGGRGTTKSMGSASTPTPRDAKAVTSSSDTSALGYTAFGSDSQVGRSSSGTGNYSYGFDGSGNSSTGTSYGLYDDDHQIGSFEEAFGSGNSLEVKSNELGFTDNIGFEIQRERELDQIETNTDVKTDSTPMGSDVLHNIDELNIEQGNKSQLDLSDSIVKTEASQADFVHTGIAKDSIQAPVTPPEDIQTELHHTFSSDTNNIKPESDVTNNFNNPPSNTLNSVDKFLDLSNNPNQETEASNFNVELKQDTQAQ